MVLARVILTATLNLSAHDSHEILFKNSLLAHDMKTIGYITQGF